MMNDINPHLINFYRWIQIGLEIDIETQNDAVLYYNYRNEFNSLIRSEKQWSRRSAELFYYLNKTGFNGLCRFNQKGEYNVPFGKYKKINYCKNFHDYIPVFSNWQFNCCDFEKLSIEKDDFIYADPPYDVEFTQYSKEDFSWTDQVRLAKWLNKQNVPVITSNQATQRILELYMDLGFSIEVLQAPRMISCNGDRTPAAEILAIKGIE